MDWLAALQHLRAEGQAGVLVTVVSARGHTPREPGAKMVVTRAGTWDSIGGGNLEATAIEQARQMLAGGALKPQTLQLSLNEHVATSHGRQCCGGEVSLLLEPLGAPAVVAIFGIGHVGHELARILSRLPLALHLVDSRTGYLTDTRLADVIGGPAQVHRHHAPAPEGVLADLPAGAHLVIMTHDHAEDLVLCEAALRRDDLGTVGLIGSNAKWARFRKRLAEAGHADSTIDRITCPIGLPGVTGKAPALIALSVAAALAQELQQPATPAAARQAPPVLAAVPDRDQEAVMQGQEAQAPATRRTALGSEEQS